jgi:hypothetical protein
MLGPASSRKVSEGLICAGAKECGMICLLVKRAETTKRVVERVLGKGLHGGSPAVVAVSVGVQGVKWSVVMKH